MVPASINVEVNPTQHLLQVKFIVMEEGNHIFSVVDLLGNVTKIYEFYAKPTEKTEHQFDHSIINFPNGNYNIIMQSPSRTYNNNFIIAK